jgi:DNA primase
MGKIPQTVIDRILDRIDIVQIVSEYVQLKKTGRNFKACCPFHNEKTPSFVVSPDKQIYHCFGCGEGGNLISFVMKQEGTDFPETVRQLAARAGVDIPVDRGADRKRNSLTTRVYEANRTAVSFFGMHLRGAAGKAAMRYLDERGLKKEILDEFRIGYAPDSWESLKQYCRKKGFRPELLRKAGLTVEGRKGRGDYDRFRNRIIFPVFTERGYPAGFGGRVLDDSLPKYINTPESPVYSKSNLLYGLNYARKGIRDKGSVVLVEGYMDVIVPYQYGIRNLVATSGTALTPEQVRMLAKYTDTAVILFDSDNAGEAASLRGLDILLERGLKVRVAELPEGHDPDSFVRERGGEAFEERLSRSKDLFDYKLELLLRDRGSENKAGVVDEMLPTIAKVDNAVVQSHYLRKLAESLSIHEESLRYEMKKVKPDYSYSYSSEGETDSAQVNYLNSEIHLLGLAVTDKNTLEAVRQDLALDKFRDTHVRKVMSTLFERETDGNISPGKLLSRFQDDEHARTAIVHALAKADITKDPEKAYKDCLCCVLRENREEELRELKKMLKKAEADNDENRVMDLVIRINKLTKKEVA